jgi:hypothetical protein
VQVCGLTVLHGGLYCGERNMHGFGNGSFDPQTLVIVETAFDEAWITLRTNGHDNIRPDELARRIVHLAMEGERDPVQLHDGALLALIPATTWRDTISSEQRVNALPPSARDIPRA